MNVKAYLERINYHGSLALTAETLRDLQVAHLQTVPFENLSIHAGEPIVLEDEALFTKIVERKRGGFCYEANGLFAALLRGLGFDVAMLSAEVADDEGAFGPAFDHMTLMVTLERRWLVDVGFGDSFLEPLLLDERGDQVQGGRSYRILTDGAYHILEQREKGGEWKPQYRFSLEPHGYADYEEMCRYHQTSAESHFTRNRICSRATGEGRVTLSDMRLITTDSNRERLERTLNSREEYDAVLREQFGIVMTPTLLPTPAGGLVFKRLSEVDRSDIIELMNNPLVRRHMPLAAGNFGPAECDEFIAAKEGFWKDYGYGPWAFIIDGAFAGWGGLQPEGREVDLGMVLHPKYWGTGRILYKEIISIAFGSMCLNSVTVLLPPTRTRVRGIMMLGFQRDSEVEIAGKRFIRYRLNGGDT